MSFPRYAEYKDSGVEWLGEVPAHWEVKRLKRCFDLITEKSNNRVNPVALENIESWSGRFISSETEFQGEGVSFNIGDILFGKLRPYLAKALLAGRSGEAVGDFHVLRPKSKLHGRFGLYQILNREFISIIDGSTFGAKMPRASWDFMAVMPLAVPPEAEQSTIGIFLDRETRKIDALVAEQEKLIALLKEQRQAVISHAVTKGLDPTVPMKDSGIEWLAEVPEHWMRTPLKHALISLIDTEHKTAPFYDNGNYLVVRTTNIKSGHLVFDGAKYTDEDGFKEWSKRGVPAAGDILFTREAPAGEACLVPKGIDLCVGQRVVLMKINKNLLVSGYALHSLYGGVSSEFMNMLSQGSTVAHFNMEDIRNIPVLLPSTTEQQEIAIFLECEISELDALVAEAQRAIDLLKERRSALISAAVTGKIDVRERVKQAQPSAELVPA